MFHLSEKNTPFIYKDFLGRCLGGWWVYKVKDWGPHPESYMLVLGNKSTLDKVWERLLTNH